MKNNTGLRIAIIWEGAVTTERTFEAKDNRPVVFSKDPYAKRVVVVPRLEDDVELFIPDGDSYLVKFPAAAGGTISIHDEEKSLEEWSKSASAVGSVRVNGTTSKLCQVTCHIGDYGIITIDDVSVYFQVYDTTIVVPITAFDLPFQVPLAASFVISSFLHATLLMLALLSPEYDPHLAELRALDRFASFMVDDVDDPLEEEEVEEEVVEEDTTGKKAGGEEGKFGDDEAEFEESKIPKTDGEMVDKIDVKNIGINKALSSDVLGSGALKNVFGNSDGLEAKMNVAMSGEGGTLQIGRGAGGMGFRGTGSGGGGEGLGRVGGLGKVDTGGGKGTGAKLGRKKARKAKPGIKTGAPNLGDFCDKNNIRRVVGAKSRAIKYCFEKELQTNPELSGKVTASWQVGLDGKVLSASIASTTLKNTTVEGCMLRVIKQMRFQAPEGGICVIKYPFIFTGLE